MSHPALGNLARIGQIKAEPRNEAEDVTKLTVIK
jgi:hypothetical protein